MTAKKCQLPETQLEKKFWFSGTLNENIHEGWTIWYDHADSRCGIQENKLILVSHLFGSFQSNLLILIEGDGAMFWIDLGGTQASSESNKPQSAT